MVNRRWIYWLPEPLRNKLNGRINLQTVLANSGWLIFDKIIRIFLGLFVGAWVARYLGPAQYGELAYALSYIAIFQAITTLGMDGILVRHISQNKTLANQTLGTCFLLRLIVGITCWLVAVIGYACIYGWGDRSVWIIAIAGGGLIFQVADTFDIWFQSQSRNRYTVTAKLTAYILSSSIKILLIILKAPLLAFAILIALESLAIAFSLGVTYLKYPCKEKWDATLIMARRLISESWPVLLSAICITTYMRIDQIIINNVLGKEMLGIYAAILPLSTTWQVIPMALAISIGPILAAKKKEDENSYFELLGHIFRYYVIIAWLICIPVFLFSNYIIELMYGGTYAESGDILKIHIFTNIFINLGVAQSMWIVNESKSKIFLLQVAIGALVSVLGNLWLLPQIGIIAAPIVAVAAQAFAAVISNIFISPPIFKLQIRSLLLISRNKFAT